MPSARVTRCFHAAQLDPSASSVVILYFLMSLSRDWPVLVEVVVVPVFPDPDALAVVLEDDICGSWRQSC
jgi:hypothetical protein